MALLACHPPPAPTAAAPEVRAAIRASGPACGETHADCDGVAENGCEIETDFDAKHCGECSRACGDGERCVVGRCRRTGVMDASIDHGCWLVDGRVRCRGDNRYGELGDGNVLADGASRVAVAEVLDVEGAVAVTAGGDLVMGRSSCALTREGAVWCWGIGIGGRPKRAQGFDDAVDISVASRRLCAVLDDGAVRCADVAPAGDFALPDQARVGGIDDGAQIVAGTPGVFFACALRRSGEALWWTYATTPRALELPGPIQQLAGGDWDPCALLRDGRVACWSSGDDFRPQLVPGVADAVEIASSVEHVCMIRRGGGVACYGHSSARDVDYPEGELVAIRGAETAVDVMVSEDDACAMLANGEVVCWDVGPEPVARAVE
jgi:hypothetical protein